MKRIFYFQSYGLKPFYSTPHFSTISKDVVLVTTRLNIGYSKVKFFTKKKTKKCHMFFSRLASSVLDYNELRIKHRKLLCICGVMNTKNWHMGS